MNKYLYYVKYIRHPQPSFDILRTHKEGGNRESVRGRDTNNFCPQSKSRR